MADCGRLPQNDPVRDRQVFQLARRGMFIQTQDTPNPNAMMFLPGQDVMGEVRFAAFRLRPLVLTFLWSVAAGRRHCRLLRHWRSTVVSAREVTVPNPRCIDSVLRSGLHFGNDSELRLVRKQKSAQSFLLVSALGTL